MSRWRVALLAGLVLLPILFLIGAGFVFLWEHGWAFWAWWPMAGCFALAWLLAWRWQSRRQLLAPVGSEPERHWTERDRAAWEIVHKVADRGDSLTAEQLANPQTYRQASEELALDIARHYQPNAQDPYGRLTVPEILAVAELASQDLTELVQTYVPGSHMMTIDHWKQARQAVDWYKAGTNAYWMAMALVSPVETALRYAASQYGLARPMAKLQENVQQWFFSAYVHRVGHYLIELHSGRLRVGAKRYRELMAQHAPLPGPPNESRSPSADVGEDRVEPTPARSSESVTLTLIGQVKAGKSSLVNALLGERRAATDVLPLTDAITRYHLAPLPGVGTSLAILDTVGYGREGPRADQLPATEKAASESDALLLVLHATNPGRQADLALLERLETWFAAHPEYKKPPIVGVLTHVDLLTPAMEWSPPYDWAAGQRRKEQAMRDAITAVTEHFGSRLAGIVPVCVADGKVWNVRDGLLGVLAARMDEAGAVGLVRALHAEANEGRVRKLWSQLVAGGRAALGVLAERVVR